MNKKNFKAASLAAALCVAGAVSSPASAGVLQGVFDDIFESNFYTIGSGANALSFEWSTAGPDDSGYFYARGPDAVAICIAQNLSDPKTITNASSFAYQVSGQRGR